jgi:TetR/AcrR family transcriptional regulator
MPRRSAIAATATPPGPTAAPDAILDAAERLFAERGFERTTAQAIGRAVGASPGLIYYYFGSKAGLYRAVLERIIRGIVERGLAEADASADPVDVIRGFVRIQAEGLAARPHTGRLIMREMLDHQASHAEPLIRELIAGLFARLTAAIREGQAAGRFDTRFDPRFAAISTMAQVAWLVTASPAIGVLLGHGPAGPPVEVREAFARHAADFAVSALEAPAGVEGSR